MPQVPAPGCANRQSQQKATTVYTLRARDVHFPWPKRLRRCSPHGVHDHRDELFFRAFARRISAFVASSWAFAGAALTIIIWAAAGPLYHYSDTWQLVINTGTTVVTFMMVFLMQNTQNRDAEIIVANIRERKTQEAAARGTTRTKEQCDQYRGFWTGGECRISQALNPGPVQPNEGQLRDGGSLR
jgi:hypothetical protein